MERYSAILFKGDFAAAPALLARACGIEVAQEANSIELHTLEEIYAQSDKDTENPLTRNIMFYSLGKWTVLADWHFDFTDSEIPVRASKILNCDVLSVHGVEDQGFGFVFSKNGELVRSVISGFEDVQLIGESLVEEPEGNVSDWDFSTPSEIADKMGAGSIFDDPVLPGYSLELFVEAE